MMSSINEMLSIDKSSAIEAPLSIGSLLFTLRSFIASSILVLYSGIDCFVDLSISSVSFSIEIGNAIFLLLSFFLNISKRNPEIKFEKIVSNIGALIMIDFQYGIDNSYMIGLRN